MRKPRAGLVERARNLCKRLLRALEVGVQRCHAQAQRFFALARACEVIHRDHQIGFRRGFPGELASQFLAHNVNAFSKDQAVRDAYAAYIRVGVGR